MANITNYVASGVIASRPATPSNVASGGSSFWYATDESLLYVWDEVASAWDLVSSGSSGGGSGGGGSGGAWEFDQTVTVSSAAQLDAPLGTDSAYLIFYDFLPVTDNVTFNARVTTDAFATVKSGAADYKGNVRSVFVNGTEANTSSGVSGTDAMSISPFVGNVSDEGCRGFIQVFGPSNTSVPVNVTSQGTRRSSDNNPATEITAWHYETAGTAVDGFRFFFSSGNISSGTVHIYKLKTTKSNVLSINTQTGTAYTLAASDEIVEMNNAAANTLTLPTNSATEIPIGARFYVTQYGAGATSVAGDTGVTLNGVSAGSTTITARYDQVNLYKRDTDEWIIEGPHGAVA